jgi:hypothetical protein
MEEKNLIKKIQNDLVQSKAKIINNNDNTSTIKKNFNSKYTEDISDSDNDSDLTSYKNRNNKVLSDLPDKNNNKEVKLKSKTKKTSSSDIEIHKVVEAVEVSDELEDEHQYEFTEELKKKVKDYVKNDDRIRELQTELKLLNNAKKSTETEILKHLERLGETNINITGGKLRINQYESKEGLKEDIIKEALSERIKDPTIIEFIFEKINEKRIANGKVQKSLKRTFERAGGKKEKNN